MNNKIYTPGNALKFVLFQRTEYLDADNFLKALNSIGLLKGSSSFNITLKACLFAPKIRRKFNEDMLKEYCTLKAFLPKTAASILDIGCGVAGIDVFINRHYSNNVGICLLDKTSVNKNVYYGFERSASFYNSLDVAKNLLLKNGVESKNIYTQEATDKNEIKFENKFDVVLSLISWGFHYPVSTYLDAVYEKIANGGVLIMDIRKGTGGEEEIKNKFNNLEIIFETVKYMRVLAKK